MSPFPAIMPNTMPPSPPVALTIAGSDSSAGAGIQADLKVFSALGCYGVSALTSVVAEIPGQVRNIALLNPDIILSQVAVLQEGFPITAAKTGMLGGNAQIRAVIEAWQPFARTGVPLVVDPVMVSTSGRRLLEADAMDLLTGGLLPLANLITPNLDEAAVLLGSRIENRGEMETAGQTLAERYGSSILVKGGHLTGDAVPDLLVHEGQLTWFEGRRIPRVRTHGTGCTYSAAITALLAQGVSLPAALPRAKAFMTAAIENFFRWNHEGAALDALNPFAAAATSLAGDSPE